MSRRFIRGIGIKGFCIIDYSAKRLRRGDTSIPGPMSQIGDYSRQKVKKLFWMSLLDIGELLGSSIPDKLSAARLQQAMKNCQLGCPGPKPV